MFDFDYFFALERRRPWLDRGPKRMQSRTAAHLHFPPLDHAPFREKLEEVDRSLSNGRTFGHQTCMM